MDYYPETESDGFDKKSKKKGRKGNFDESRDVDKDTYDYFQRVMENLETQEFEDEEEKCKIKIKVSKWPSEGARSGPLNDPKESEIRGQS